MSEPIDGRPFWWRAAPLQSSESGELPSHSDVVIVGSGITGLVASLPLARAGRSVTIIDSGQIGSGASTRNAGFVSRSFKHSFSDLEKRHGLDYAINLHRELQASVDSVAQTVREEGIDCHHQMLGRLMPATSAGGYEALARDLEAQRKHLGFEFEMLSKPRLREELASDVYEGGALIPDLGGLHPGLYHAGLLRSAREAGVRLVEHTHASALQPQADGSVRVQTSRGRIVGRDVIVATNGYSDSLMPWLRRRVIPFDAHMIATEEMSPQKVRELIPNGRVCIDTNHNPLFVRPSPDGRRLLFGALTAEKPTTPEEKGGRLLGMLRQLLPDLGEVRAEHSWTGRCCGTFDLYPHLGQHHNIHYSLGYCFVGVPMGTYLGRKIAQSILHLPEAQTLFANRPFPSVPLYRERPWFLPAVFGYYNFLDRRTAAGSIR